MRISSSLRLAISALCALLLGACALAPATTYQVESVAMPPASRGLLSSFAGRIASDLAPNESAYWLLDQAELAFEARLALVDHATESLDLQYFIWEPSVSGRLLVRRLIAAADRGVRIRLLLDDLTMAGRDWEFLPLAEHPGIEVRSFNPWRARSKLIRVTEFFTKFGELNHRMHLKTVVADGHFAATGGRNIGDRYFGLHEVFVQSDLDVMTVGPMVAELADSFDEFWNSTRAYPVRVIGKPGRRSLSLDELTEMFEDEYMAEQEKLAGTPLEPWDWRDFFAELAADYAKATGDLIYDSPYADEHGPRVLYDRFRDFVAGARERVIISTAYLIPGDDMLELFTELVERGVEVTLVTNSLATNNHMIAHTGYRRWRRRLLDSGVALYELMPDAEAKSFYTLPPTDPGFVGLHTKAAVVDHRWSFIGSANVDPRSLLINQENGLFLESEKLASELAALLERDLAPWNSWRVTKDDEGWLYWCNEDGVLERQPAQGFKQRFFEFFINLLPIKNQA